MTEPREATYVAHDAVRTLIAHFDPEPDREGVADTPRRVVDAFREMTEGYRLDPATILDCHFDGGNYDQLVICRNIDFVSLCEHHLLPFVGTADVGYLPGEGGRIVGLSKLARLVDCFARRFQVQERMTQQIADTLMEHTQASGVGVVVRASHACMACRGVKKPGAQMVTSAMLGTLRSEDAARAEFLSMTQG